MPLSAGDSLPKGLELTIRNADTCPAKTEALTMEQLFGGKRSVIFAVPGAFTPTCRCAKAKWNTSTLRELMAASANNTSQRAGDEVDLSEMRLTWRPCC